MAEVVWYIKSLVTNRSAASSSIGLVHTPLSMSAWLSTVPFPYSSCFDWSQDANICSRLLNTKSRFISKSYKMYREINSEGGERLALSLNAVYVFEVFSTVKPKSVLIEYEWEHLRVSSWIAFSTMCLLSKNIWIFRTDRVLISNVAMKSCLVELRTFRWHGHQLCRPQNLVRRRRRNKRTRARVALSWQRSRQR